VCASSLGLWELRPRSVIPFSPPFLDFVKRIPPTLILHVASLTFSVKTFLSELPSFFSDPFWMHPVIARLAMIAINTNFLIVTFIKLQLPCDLFAVAKLEKIYDMCNTDF
jgi:hypothetical protein